MSLTIAYAVNQTNGSVLYTLKSTSITVDTVIEFVQCKELSIVGDNQEGTTIVCTCGMDSSCGMIFNGSESIILSGFKITGCSVTAPFTKKKVDKPKFLIGIIFKQCKNVTLNYISCINNTGFGLSFINLGGNISIFRSNFSSNHLVEHSKMKHGGGGLVIISTEHLQSSIKVRLQ